MKKIKGYITLVALFCLFGYVGFKIIKVIRTNTLLETKAVRIKAVIIDDLNYTGHSHISKDYTYSYMFTVDGKEYTGNSNDTKLKIGDSIEVEYVKGSPSLNKALHPNE